MLTLRIKYTVTAFLLSLAFSGPVAGQQTDLDALFQELIDADEQTHERVADRIMRQFEQSGSAAMDLLLRRGNDAAEEGDFKAAIEHFSALVDHAPDFAEGYHSRGLGLFFGRADGTCD